MMSIQFCVIRRKIDGFVLCNAYSSGYHYSEYTHADASVSSGFIGIKDCFGPHDSIEDSTYTLVLFENREKASNYITKNFSPTTWNPLESPSNYEILGFGEIDEIVEKILLTEKFNDEQFLPEADE